MQTEILTSDELLLFINRNEDLARVLGEVRSRLDEDPAHDLAHALRVSLWTIRLGQGQLEPRMAIAAALLHDVVNVPKNSPERSKASEFSAKVASEILLNCDFTSDQTQIITEAIRDHSFSRGVIPHSLLGKCLQDSDRLESLGALGIMRTISTGIRMKASYFHAEDPWAKSRSLDDTSFSVDHFYNKILKLPALLNTEAGKIEAKKRASTIESFLNSLAEELGQFS